jgi:hypothetical protein
MPSRSPGRGTKKPPMPPTSLSKSPRLPGSRATVYQALIQKSRDNIADLVTTPTTWTFDPDGDYSRWPDGFFTIGNWTTSFFTGMALISWIETEDDEYVDRVLAMDPLYQAKVDGHAADTMNDPDFLCSLYSVALYKLTGDPSPRALGLKAANVFADRFIPGGSYLHAWRRMDEVDSEHAGIAIIDCMMNLPLLFCSSEETGGPRFKTSPSATATPPSNGSCVTTIRFPRLPLRPRDRRAASRRQLLRPLGGQPLVARGRLCHLWIRGELPLHRRSPLHGRRASPVPEVHLAARSGKNHSSVGFPGTTELPGT